MTKRHTKKIYSFAAIAILAVALLLIYTMSKDNGGSELTKNDSLEIKFNKQGSLNFVSANDTSVMTTIDIEVADNDQLRARGLMYRKSIPSNAGMLFVFNREDYQSFWMKNTYIALDILYVNANKEIVTIHTNTAPLNERSYASTQPAMYVVEVNAGYCIQNGIKEGDFIDFEY